MLAESTNITFRVRNLISAFLFAAICALTIAGAASAAVLNETEPNETALAANGPIPADGMTALRSTSNDQDFGYIFLRDKSQVTFSVAPTAGSCYTTSVRITATDVLGRIYLDEKSVNISQPFSWTTPELPVKVVVDFWGTWSGAVGCGTLFKAAPTTAVFGGPLPEPPPRTIAISPISSMVVGKRSVVTLSGSAIDGDKTSLELVRAADGSCGTAPTADGTDALLQGQYSSASAITPTESGNFLLCAWLVNSNAKVSAGAAVQRVVVRKRAKASIAIRTVRRGDRLRAKFKNAKGFATFEFYRKGSLVRSQKARIFKAKASTSTAKLRKGTYRLRVMASDQKVLVTTVWITR